MEQAAKGLSAGAMQAPFGTLQVSGHGGLGGTGLGQMFASPAAAPALPVLPGPLSLLSKEQQQQVHLMGMAHQLGTQHSNPALSLAFAAAGRGQPAYDALGLSAMPQYAPAQHPSLANRAPVSAYSSTVPAPAAAPPVASPSAPAPPPTPAEAPATNVNPTDPNSTTGLGQASLQQQLLQLLAAQNGRAQ